MKEEGKEKEVKSHSSPSERKLQGHYTDQRRPD